MQEKDVYFFCSLDLLDDTKKSELKKEIVKSFNPACIQQQTWPADIVKNNLLVGNICEKEDNFTCTELKWIGDSDFGIFSSKEENYVYSVWVFKRWSMGPKEIFKTSKDKIKNFHLKPNGSILIVCERETYLLT